MHISTREKTSVPREFDRVAKAYDLLTALNPGYRRHLELSAQRLGLAPGATILDVCCGTGLSTAALRKIYPDARITALDYSANMLRRAQKKPELGAVRWVHGDAMDPARFGICDAFDAIYMAYGIRNVPDPDVCLGNLVERLKPGGSICVHEYSVADSRKSRIIWNAISLGIVIPSARIFAGSTDLFHYLRRSVLAFDGVSAFEDRLRRAGLAGVHTAPMTGWQRGIVHTFLARKPIERTHGPGL